MPDPSSHFGHTLAVPEEARNVSSAVHHGHDLNGGLLRVVDDQIRTHGPEPQGLVCQVRARVAQTGHRGKPLKGRK
jgi:hypothetical protein